MAVFTVKLALASATMVTPAHKKGQPFAALMRRLQPDQEEGLPGGRGSTI